MKNKAPILQILIGAPGSGKSTYARYVLRTGERWMRLSRDDFRSMQFSDTLLENKSEGVLTDIFDVSIERLLSKHYNVMVDATHCRKEYIEHYIQKFNHLAEIQFKLFDIDLQELKKRCEERYKQNGKFISAKTTTKFYDELQLLKTEFSFETLPIKTKSFNALTQDNTKPPCFIVDLDGTLADANGRNMFNPTEDEVKNDLPILAVVEVIKSLSSQYEIIYLSGREDTYFKVTKEWIIKHVHGGNEQELHLFMRKSGDYRRDSVVKKEILREHILPNYFVKAAFDDRLQVIKECWNEENIFTFNVNQFLIDY